MFVIQYRFHEWEKWKTINKRYPTLAEARAALDAMPIKTPYRIAEEYTIIRYKAVKGG